MSRMSLKTQSSVLGTKCRAMSRMSLKTQSSVLGTKCRVMSRMSLKTQSSVLGPRHWLRGFHARVQVRVEQIGDQVGQHHADGQQQERPLEHRVVAPANRLEDRAAQP